LAGNSFGSYLNWAKEHTIEHTVIEQPFVSENYRYGGTPDLLATIDGVATLVDFKTGKALYPEHDIQVAAYWMLLVEHGFSIDMAMILRIGRTDDEGFEIKPVKNYTDNSTLFMHCMAVYELQKKLRREEK